MQPRTIWDDRTIERTSPAMLGDIGGRIRRRRRQVGLTQRELGELLGFRDGSYVCRLERGKVGLPTLCTIVDLARVLRCTIDFVIMGSPERHVSFMIQNGLMPASIVQALHHLPFNQAMDCYCVMYFLQGLKRQPVSLEKVDWVKFYEQIKEWLD